MTEAARPSPARPPATGVGAGAWYGGLAVFLAVLALLGWRMGNGRDPALGASQPAATASAPRQVLVKRIKRKIIITRIEGPGGTAATSASGSGGTTVGAAPAARSSAPAAAPAPAAPAPAPAPAPVTRSS